MQALIIDNGSAVIVQLVAALRACGCHTQVLSLEKLDPQRLPDCDLIVLSGSHRHSVQNHFHSAYASEAELIKAVKVPVLGICLGFELIAKVYGSKLQRLPVKVHGMQPVEVVNKNGLFSADGKVELYESHRWAVTTVGSELEVLANSESGIEAVKVKYHHVYGTQFHPELSGKAGKEILASFVGLAAG